MGREVRMVPKDWQHPKRENGQYIPLFGRSFEQEYREYTDVQKRWSQGEKGYYSNGEWFSCGAVEDGDTPEDWLGPQPNIIDYMPEWAQEERTHYMMYEDTTEGTPISPAFATPEKLAQWLVDNKASALGDFTASYESWIATIKATRAPSMVFDPSVGELQSGVEHAGDVAELENLRKMWG